MRYLAVLLLALLAAGCATPENYYRAPLNDLWRYQLVDTYGNTWDAGTFSFSGSDVRGDVVEQNNYGQALKGTWSVAGNDVVIQASVTIEANWNESNAMQGSWRATNGDGGEFYAVRREAKLPSEQ
ncbi:hypothetical protein [Salinibius halmophilus]|uniref:hypothetical protein n=1 Tax=Salinibius halmophilus TaxID=1853216 RepID=UPI000E66BB89|nr:hypothetical protein [Salinibius halmophilus]